MSRHEGYFCSPKFCFRLLRLGKHQNLREEQLNSLLSQGPSVSDLLNSPRRKPLGVQIYECLSLSVSYERTIFACKTSGLLPSDVTFSVHVASCSENFCAKPFHCWMTRDLQVTNESAYCKRKKSRAQLYERWIALIA